MIELTLLRVGVSERGTFGVLIRGRVPFAITLERPWWDNQMGISSIPNGTYLCQRVRSPKFGDTFEVTKVPGRTQILLHKGNTTDDTEGCILVAEEFGGTYDKPMVVSSERGFHELMDLLKDETSFPLTIRTVDTSPMPLGQASETV